MMRASGILMPISSLPSRYGIGTFGKSAYEFADSLEKAGQKYWQILPLGSTGYGDSPYQSFSTFAGNPYFIDLELLCDEGLLKKEECEAADFGDDPVRVDYEKIYRARFLMLRKAFSRFDKNENDYIFFKKEMDWLEDYAMYMAVKQHFQQAAWQEWEEDIKLREPKAMERYRKLCAEEIEFYSFIQYLFTKQWNALKLYVNNKGIKIIGDIPIYVALDSADTWANTSLFQMDEDHVPTRVAGCPPDSFSATGQLWGNPLYDWPKHKENGYAWWVKRIQYSFTLYDTVRIDHFRGFDEYYAIPYGDKTAEFGRWEKGPGYDFFKTVEKKLGKLDIIAEDLGFLTPSVYKLLKQSGYPGMKVLQFAFDSREESDYLPHNYDKNCVVYTGTHDNNTLAGWYREICRADRMCARKYLQLGRKKCYNWDFIRAAYMSTANLAVIPMQDFLELGSEARMNTPSTLGGNNWKWRMKAGAFTDELAQKIKDLCQTYAR
ncbi:4-alpha-glucanotransferase [uncultured Ruminococcus sp.]|nr:4-alpha-glucanotransferase [uncultured Clostridium sp.]SCI48112.1 4-alpha-glucanotransferase [uncultured Ruminococcus sp.]